MPKQDYHALIQLFQDTKAASPQSTRKYHWFAGEAARQALSKKYIGGSAEVCWHIAELSMQGQRISTQIALLGADERLSTHSRWQAPGNPSAIAPTVSIQHSLGRTTRSADIDVQFVPGCAGLLDPEVLTSRDAIAEIEELMRVIDLSQIILAGSETCRDQLETYFAISPDRIITLPSAPVIRRTALEGLDDADNSGLGDFGIVYLANGPDAKSAEDSAVIASRLTHSGAPVKMVAIWDWQFGTGGKADWRKAFNSCFPVADHQRQWLFARAKALAFVGLDDGADAVSAEAQILGQQVIMPMADAYRPLAKKGITPRAHAIWVDPTSIEDAAGAFCDSLLDPVEPGAIQEDIAKRCADWSKSEADATMARWKSMDFRI